MAEVTGSADYRDASPLPEATNYDPDQINAVAQTIAGYLRTKMHGVDVREALARAVLIMAASTNKASDDESAFESTATQRLANQDSKIGAVEDRQTEVEDKIQSYIQASSDAGTDTGAEVIDARSSDNYGNFATLDKRMENIESLLASKVAAGFSFTLAHGLSGNPTVTVKYYEYAIGTEPSGLATGPSGTFGGTATVVLPSNVTYVDSNTVKIDLPIKYQTTVEPELGPDGAWYSITGKKTIKIEFA